MAYDRRLPQRALEEEAMLAFRSCTALVFLSAAFAAFAQDAAPLYVVSYVEVTPRAQPDAVALLKALGDAGRKDEGNLRYAIVQQMNRPNHFSVVEVWKSREAFDAHSMSGYIREFRDKLAPMSGALYDERLYDVLN